MPLSLTLLRFPEIHLEKRDAHKLRGYFGNLFQEPLILNLSGFENLTGLWTNKFSLAQLSS